MKTLKVCVHVQESLILNFSTTSTAVMLECLSQNRALWDISGERKGGEIALIIIEEPFSEHLFITLLSNVSSSDEWKKRLQTDRIIPEQHWRKERKKERKKEKERERIRIQMERKCQAVIGAWECVRFECFSCLVSVLSILFSWKPSQHPPRFTPQMLWRHRYTPCSDRVVPAAAAAAAAAE